MEPLGALSLACNIIQIVEYGGKILTKTAEYHSATNGVLDDHNALRNVMDSLRGLNDEFAASLASLSGSTERSIAEKRLLSANLECAGLANQLIGLLEQLKVNKRSTLENLRMSIRSLRYEDRVKSMRVALADAKDNLNIASLLYMQETQSRRHSEILKASGDTERRIFHTIQYTSKSLGSEIKALTTQLENMSLTSVETALADFRSSHRESLAELSGRLDAVLSQSAFNDIHQRDDFAFEPAKSEQGLLASLQFPQMEERRNQISNAHGGTYGWILHATDQGNDERDNFVRWASSSEDNRKVYWIHGKPGSGKSTLMQFIHDHLDTEHHLSPWRDNHTVAKISHFLWGPGSTLQKSLVGLLRSLLAQMFALAPDLIRKYVPKNIMRHVAATPNHNFQWVSSDILPIVLETLRSERMWVFILIDGLDELEGTDQDSEDLLNLIHHLSTFRHVKLCISSRPWNLYRDHFADFPKLTLESHTFPDIQRYVNEKLSSQRRFHQLQQFDPLKGKSLTEMITQRASGVFLWVRLVTHELVKALRDGDNLQELIKKVEDIPDTLDAYFTRLMDSVQPQHRKESYLLLQVALYEEDAYTNLQPLRLLDTMYIQHGSDSFAMKGSSGANELDFENISKTMFQLDSALRRINSRCLGVLECRYIEYSISEYCGQSDDQIGSGYAKSNYSTDGSNDGGLEGLQDDESGQMTAILASNPYQAFIWGIDFLHRSFRDFLQLPTNRIKLQQYNDNTFNPRLFLCNARLRQLEAVVRSSSGNTITIRLAGYILSTLAVPDLKYTQHSIEIANRLKPLLDRIVSSATDQALDAGPWYLCRSLSCYHHESSSFLTIAIDFDMVAYVCANLTREAIRSKKGRPILDYILRGRFDHEEALIGSCFPNIQLVNMALHLGADPNETYGSLSVWSCFLLWLDSNPALHDSTGVTKQHQEILLQTALVLLKHGAEDEILLPTKQTTISGFPPIYTENATSGGREESLHIIRVADYLSTLRKRYALASKQLDACIALASGVQYDTNETSKKGMGTDVVI